MRRNATYFMYMALTCELLSVLIYTLLWFLMRFTLVENGLADPFPLFPEQFPLSSSLNQAHLQIPAVHSAGLPVGLHTKHQLLFGGQYPAHHQLLGPRQQYGGHLRLRDHQPFGADRLLRQCADSLFLQVRLLLIPFSF
jgi:hypothetical protein